jgi:hypothetical protein
VSPVVFPDQTLRLSFSHADHLRDGRTDCFDCHAAAARSRSSLDDLLPTEAACRPCHAIDRARPDAPDPPGRPPGRCAACHPDHRAGQPVVRSLVPPPNLIFDHAAHLARGTGCARCHGDLLADGVGRATREHLPVMASCLTCHDGAAAPSRCATCHPARGGGRLVTRFASGELRPSAAVRGADHHDLGFATDHRLVAQADRRLCRNCHREDDCIECHQGVVKPMAIHGNDYVLLHAIDARRDATDCGGCHRQQSFCVGCHSRSGVSADGRGSEFLGPSSGDLTRRFHPPGWVTFGAAGPEIGQRGADHHAFQAQRNLRQCASCHREEHCLTCHSAQPSSFQVSPHPRGWAGSRRCEALAARNPRMCLRCHIDFDRVSCE